MSRTYINCYRNAKKIFWVDAGIIHAYVYIYRYKSKRGETYIHGGVIGIQTNSCVGDLLVMLGCIFDVFGRISY